MKINYKEFEREELEYRLQDAEDELDELRADNSELEDENGRLEQDISEIQSKYSKLMELATSLGLTDTELLYVFQCNDGPAAGYQRVLKQQGLIF
jgi:predicted nuclease with TOPRIM domain